MSALADTSASMVNPSTKASSTSTAPLTPPPGVDYITFHTQQAQAKFAATPPTKPAQPTEVRNNLEEQVDMNRRLDRCIEMSQQMIEECRTALRRQADAVYSSQESETSLELTELNESRSVSLQLARLASAGLTQTMQRTTYWVLDTPSTFDYEHEASTGMTGDSSNLDSLPTKDSTLNTSPSLHDAGESGRRCSPSPVECKKSPSSLAVRRRQACPGLAGQGASLFSFEVCWKW